MRLRRGWPLIIFVMALVAVPTVEVWLLAEVAHQIGFWPTLAILVAEAALGAWLMRREGSRAWAGVTAAFSTGRVAGGELADAALILVGGVLLILPGFLTDVIGFLFLLPLTRPLARRLMAFFIARRMSRLAGSLGSGHGRPGDPGGTVIGGETVGPNHSAGGDSAGGSTALRYQGVISGEVVDGPVADRSGERPSSGGKPSGPSPAR